MQTAIILAGGLGTRLRSAVPDLPKPMAPIEGKPFLSYLLEYWSKQGIARFILSVGYKHEQISAFFGSDYNGAKIEYSIESEPLGTGGALCLAKTYCRGDRPFLLLNGDTFFPVCLDNLKSHSAKTNTDICMSLFSTSDANRYMGVSVDENGLVNSFQTSSSSADFWANGGVYWCNPERLDLESRAGEFCSLENDLFPMFFDAGIVFSGKKSNQPFIDIGVPDDYHRAYKLLLRDEK